MSYCTFPSEDLISLGKKLLELPYPLSPAESGLPHPPSGRFLFYHFEGVLLLDHKMGAAPPQSDTE